MSSSRARSTSRLNRRSTSPPRSQSGRLAPSGSTVPVRRPWSNVRGLLHHRPGKGRERMRRLLLLALCGVFGALPASAPAVTGGQFDGNGHPYVAYLDNGVFACSGTLLSPTVLITAAHCFSDSTSAFGLNSVTHAPLVRATFDPNLINTPRAQRVWFFGTYYFDPQFAIGAGGGLPG